MKGTILLLFFCISIATCLKISQEFTYLENNLNIDSSISVDPVQDKRAFTVTDLHKLTRLQDTTFSKDIDNSIYFVVQNQSWIPNQEETSRPASKISYFKIKSKNNEDTNTASDLKDININGNSPKLNKSSNKLFYLKPVQVKVDNVLTKDAFSNLFFIDFPPQNPEKPEETQVTDFPVDIETYKVSDDGNSFAIVLQVYPECEDLKCSYDKRTEFLSRGPNTYQLYTQLFANHWDVWLDGRVNNVFYYFNDQKTKVGPHNLLNLPSEVLNPANSPVPPFGGDDLYDISGDGLHIAFSYVPRKDEHVNTVWKIKLIDIKRTDGKAEFTFDKKVEDNQILGRQQNPLFSKDSKTLFYTAMPRAKLESDYNFLVSYDLSTNKTTKLTDNFKYGVSGFYQYDENTIIISVDSNGQNELFFFNPKNKEIPVQIKDKEDKFCKDIPLFFEIFQDSARTTKVIAYGIVSADLSPYKLVRYNFTANFIELSTKDVYLPNPTFDSDFFLPKEERIDFKGSTLEHSQGWVIEPINYEKGKKYPVAFLIHGGPEGSWDNRWSNRWNPLLWASQGYFTVMINPEGSTGKGQDYTDEVRGSWGGHPYETLKLGFKAFIAKYPDADSNRACAAGASYGGYMVNWIQGMQGKNPDPDFSFKCLVTHDGVFSTLSMFYITDEIWFPIAEYCDKATPGDCVPYDEKYRENFTKYSPDTLVEYWSVPHLVIHGSNDLRIPVSEGLSAFTALQMRGVESRFIHFTKENHWVLKRENSIAWYENVLGWFDKYVK